jgi:hypothetical protein
MCMAILMFDARLWKCGSIDVTAVPSPSAMSCAIAGGTARTAIMTAIHRARFRAIAVLPLLRVARDDSSRGGQRTVSGAKRNAGLCIASHLTVLHS